MCRWWAASVRGTAIVAGRSTSSLEVMSKRPFTKRDLDAQVQALRDPMPMSLDQVLLTANPVSEIAIRLSSKPHNSMSEPEKVFWSVAYFVSDTMNGGLDQSLTNDTGELMPLFAEFAKRYGTAELTSLVDQISALFPFGHVPTDREERCRLVSNIDHETVDRLSELFYNCESAISEGLITMAQANSAKFDLMGSP